MSLGPPALLEWPLMGTLYLVATPIGNLEDITERALRVLRAASLVAAEDTRHTRKLFEHYGLTTPLLSYHEHNKGERMDEVLEALGAGDVALVSDAGTPGLSDPGHDLVQAAWDAGHRVSPIPGASAPVAALVAAGLPTDQFLYMGYLPRGDEERRRLLLERARDPWTLVAFEVPHRLRETLTDLEEILGPDRQAAICRELTKLHEEILRGSIRELRASLEAVEPRGEYTLVVAGAGQASRWERSTVEAAVREELAAGGRPSAVAREVAKLSGWNRRDVYQITLEDG
jgi:16S rRNA (cytidine1402-2'-O)-methyltransferase